MNRSSTFEVCWNLLACIQKHDPNTKAWLLCMFVLIIKAASTFAVPPSIKSKQSPQIVAECLSITRPEHHVGFVSFQLGHMRLSGCLPSHPRAKERSSSKKSKSIAGSLILQAYGQPIRSVYLPLWPMVDHEPLPQSYTLQHQRRRSLCNSFRPGKEELLQTLWRPRTCSMA